MIIRHEVRWADNTAALRKNLLEGVGTLDAMKSAVDRTVASLSGTGLFQAANKVAAAIQEMGGVTKLTVTHEVEGAPKLAVMITGEQEDTGAGGGWSWVLSDLKSLLETGSPMDPGDALNQG